MRIVLPNPPPPLTAMEQFSQSLSGATLDVFAHDGNNRTAIFKLLSFEASTTDFEDVLRVLGAAGCDFARVDSSSDSVLMLTNDELGVALVHVGAATCFLRNGMTNRPLAVAAANGCLRTMDAIVS